MARWEPCPDFPYVYVQGLIRERGGQWIITLFLVNGQAEPKQNKDEAWLFQPELVVEAADGSAAFEQRPLNHDRTDGESMALNMLYRSQVEFAVGHNVAVHADLCPGCTDRALRVAPSPCRSMKCRRPHPSRWTNFRRWPSHAGHEGAGRCPNGSFAQHLHAPGGGLRRVD